VAAEPSNAIDTRHQPRHRDGRPDGPPRATVHAPGARLARLRRLTLHNWPVAAKLGAVLVVPVVTALLLGGLRIGSSVDTAAAYDRVMRLAELGGRAAELGHELEGERDLAATYVADGRRTLPTDLTTRQSAVDMTTTAFRRSAAGIDQDYGQTVRRRVETVLTRLDSLGALRELTITTGLPASAVISTYTNVIADVVDLEGEIAEGSVDATLNGTVRAFSALSSEKELTSRQRALLAVAAAADRFPPGSYEEFLATSAQADAVNRNFLAAASSAQGQRYKDTVTGQRVDRAEQLEEVALARAGAPALGIDAGEWLSVAETKIDLLRKVEQTLVAEVVDRSEALTAEERRRALWGVAGVLLVLLLALLVSFAVARSMLRALRGLRASALEVADRRLPEVIERMRRGDPTGVGVTVRPVALDSNDEVGQVARAFDEVHRQAVRLAVEQAGLRSNVNSMFVNLSRRTQGLVERQLTLIDDLETGEQDPDQLANLFKLDHLATRMRRNSENLLVLAGEDAGRRWGQPVPLVDVVRAACSEVEQYHRIQLTGVPDTELQGHAVNHLVHLVAELLENATIYSPPQSVVVVHGQRLSDDGALLEIVDGGVGMSVEEMTEANERLANPPIFDVALSRMMGLYVVGRLAARHGIVVRLRRSDLRGVTAFVRIPATLLTSTGRRPAPALGPVRAGSGDGRLRGPAAAGPFGGGDRPPVPADTGGPGRRGPVAPAGRSGLEPGLASLGPGAGRRLLSSHADIVDDPSDLGDPGDPAGGWPAGPARPEAWRAGQRPEAAGPGHRPEAGGPSHPLDAAAPYRPEAGEASRLPEAVGPGTLPVPGSAPGAGTGLGGFRGFGQLAAGGPSRSAEDRVGGRGVVDAARSGEWFGGRRTTVDRDGPVEASRRIADQLAAPDTSGTTRSGLPMRVPKAHLVPGSFGGEQQSSTRDTPGRTRSPDAVRSRLADYQHGLRRGRQPEGDGT
jgi:signal transduction histidine kinase